LLSDVVSAFGGGPNHPTPGWHPGTNCQEVPVKTLFVLPLAVVVVVALLIAGAAAVTPDFALMSEAWDLQDGVWDVRPCAIPVYFAGPVAVEDRTDCGLPWAVTTL